MPCLIRFVVIALCVFAALPVYAQGKKGKGKSKPEAEPVIELDPWGRPQRKGGEELVIWQDEAGWHIRAYAGGRGNAKFSGVIRVANGKVQKLWGTQGLESKGKSQDLGVVSKDERSISFQLRLSKAGEDGFDFSVTPMSTELEISMLVNGFDHPEKIHIGANGYRATGTKFSIPIKAAK